jgi:hypothetical protein
MSIKKRHVNQLIQIIKTARNRERHTQLSTEQILAMLQEDIFDMLYIERDSLDENKFDLACEPKE